MADKSVGADGRGSMKQVDGVKCVLLDIEGTICPISFVKETLFPYAIKALPDVLANKFNDEAFIPYRDAFPEDKRTSPETLQAYVEELTKADRKDACLKNLQGYLWEEGYKTGAYATPLFPDVAPCLKQWKADGLTLAIYSSGSVFAQKLLFGHVKVQPVASREAQMPAEGRRSAEGPESSPGRKRSIDDANGPGRDAEAEAPNKKAWMETARDLEAADTTPNTDAQRKVATEDLQHLISDWFDTTNAGPKKEAKSYRTITDKLQLSPQEILFLTDSVEEYDASIAAGCRAGLLVRPGNPPLKEDEDAGRLEVMRSLRDVEPERKA